MAKLPQAPLVEVIFEMRWDANTLIDLQKYQIVVGALSTALGDRYEMPQAILPVGAMPPQALLDKVVYRAKQKSNKNMLYQIGPGVVSVNYTGNQYDWNIYMPEVLAFIKQFIETYKFNPEKQITIQLRYMDFFPKDASDDTMDFIKRYFNLNVGAAYIEHPQALGINCEEKKDCGLFRFALNSGKKDAKIDGFVLESSIQNTLNADAFSLVQASAFKEVLNNSHVFLSSFFKNITKGALYESFKIEKGTKDEQ